MITVVPGSVNQFFIVQVVTDNGLPVDALNADTWPETKILYGNAQLTITPVDLALITDPHVDGGLLFIEDGRYRLDCPDLPFAAEVAQVVISGEDSNKRIICPDIQVKEPFIIHLVRGNSPERGCGTNFETFIGEDYTARVYTLDSKNNPLDLTGVGDLEIVFETDEQTPTDLVVLAEGDFTKTSTYIEFVIPADTVNDAKGTRYWACRKVSNKVVQLYGQIKVSYAALKDSP